MVSSPSQHSQEVRTIAPLCSNNDCSSGVNTGSMIFTDGSSVEEAMNKVDTCSFTIQPDEDLSLADDPVEWFHPVGFSP